MKHFAIAEVVLGLLLAAASSYFMVDVTINHKKDLHGLLLGVALFGASLGALLSFAGATLLVKSRYRAFGHFPFLAFLVVTWIVWNGSYA